MFSNKDVVYFGKKISNEQPDDIEVKTCELIIDLIVKPTSKYNTSGSYSLKHRFENLAGMYISNGAVIRAFKNKYYFMKIIDNGPNCKIMFDFKKGIKKIMKSDLLHNLPKTKLPDNKNINKEYLVNRLGQLLILYSESRY